MCEACKESDGGCDFETGFIVFAPEIGVKVAVGLDPNGYTSDEEAEVGEMVTRVLNAWFKRRETMLMNPGVYGITVN
jgi:hypothetical protein